MAFSAQAQVVLDNLQPEVADQCLIGGDADGFPEPAETFELGPTLLNSGASAATGISAELTTSAPGVAVLGASSDYPDLPAGLSAGPNTPFQIRIDPNFECSTREIAISEGTLLGSTGNKGEALIEIDDATGAGVLRSPHGSLGPVTEIDFREDGTLFGSTATGRIIRIDPVRSTETLVGEHVFGVVNGLEFVGDTLYGTFNIPRTVGSLSLVTVDQANGTLTIIGSMGSGNVGGLAFNGVTLYGVTSGAEAENSNLLTIDLATGAATVIGATGFNHISALEFGPDGVLYGGVGGPSPDAGSLVTLDPNTGAATVIGDTGFPVVSGLSFVPPGGIEVEIPAEIEFNLNITTDQGSSLSSFSLPLGSAGELFSDDVENGLGGWTAT